ncbi:MAG: hypothetical protein WC406_01475 [Methanoregula sp.]|jgi:hypothetical protein
MTSEEILKEVLKATEGDIQSAADALRDGEYLPLASQVEIEDAFDALLKMGAHR